MWRPKQVLSGWENEGCSRSAAYLGTRQQQVFLGLLEARCLSHLTFYTRCLIDMNYWDNGNVTTRPYGCIDGVAGRFGIIGGEVSVSFGILYEMPNRYNLLWQRECNRLLYGYWSFGDYWKRCLSFDIVYEMSNCRGHSHTPALSPRTHWRPLVAVNSRFTAERILYHPILFEISQSSIDA